MAVSETPAVRNFKAGLGFATIGVMLYLSYMLVPPYFHNYQFEDAIVTEAKFASYSQKSEEQIRDDIMAKARESGVDITREQIKVVKTPTEASIEVNYVVHVDIPFHPVDLTFNPSSKNKQL